MSDEQKTTQPKFTPGPWRYTYGSSRVEDWGFIRDSSGALVARCASLSISDQLLSQCRKDGTDPTAPNAHLIAAATDLYEACQMVVDAYEGNGDIFDAARKCADAINKARGESA